MEANRRRQIRSGKEYDHWFPQAEGNNETIRKNANVYHTVEFIPKVVQETLHQTKPLAAHLKRNNIYDTCKNIWHFVYEHINYKKDATGYEQIRSPSRAWHDRYSGVDCDCYSVFISSILTNLGILHLLRITKYNHDYFQHIYPVVPFQNEFITVDCVTDRFNYEVPFSEKKDYPMDLQYLNGFEDDDAINGSGDGMAELGRLLQKRMGQSSKKASKPASGKKLLPGFLKKKKQTTAAPATGSGIPDGSPKPKKKKFLGKMLNVVNKVNPATVLLRNGILASMKLNMRNVAARLRWSYLTPQQASAKSIDLAKFQKLLNARMKLEKIFFGAGGNPKNLRKAILSGKGNKDKAVNGLDGFGMIDLEGVEYMNVNTPMSELLGAEVYYDENINGMEGLGELGEPITMSSIAAAAGVIAGIVAMLKDVGNIFQKKTKEAEDFDEAKNEEADKATPVPSPPPTATPGIVPTVTTRVNTDAADNSENILSVQTYESANNTVVKTSNDVPAAADTPAANATAAAATDTPEAGDEKTGFWEKNKKWLKPVAIGVGGLTIIGIGYSLMKGSKTQNKSSTQHKGLSGMPHSKKRKNQKHRKGKQRKKKSVALL